MRTDVNISLFLKNQSSHTKREALEAFADGRALTVTLWLYPKEPAFSVTILPLSAERAGNGTITLRGQITSVDNPEHRRLEGKLIRLFYKGGEVYPFRMVRVTM